MGRDYREVFPLDIKLDILDAHDYWTQIKEMMRKNYEI